LAPLIDAILGLGSILAAKAYIWSLSTGHLAGRRCLETLDRALTPMIDPAASPDALTLADSAAATLNAALAQAASLHLPGRRALHRRRLARAIELAHRALATPETDSVEVRSHARYTLLAANTALAQDARHGAGQLSLGAQRAPTRADCDDGWQRVEEIVAGAESAAAVAQRVAADLASESGWKAARVAQAAARDARRIVAQRNHAYTFHADPGFSFGEGWYLAAAAIVAGVAIQIEPGRPQTAQAEHFLRNAGLGPQLRPYRSRPRANKHLPEIVASAFRADPFGAQRRLRAALLGGGPVLPGVRTWVDTRLAGAPPEGKVLLWIRHGRHQPARNTNHSELGDLVRLVLSTGLVPILVGDAIPREAATVGTVDMTLFWREPVFQGIDMRRAQLHCFEHLKTAHRLVGQLGVTTAGMDGPALMGLATMYLTDLPNPRLGTWVGAVPGYQEVVRREGYLDRVGQELGHWAARAVLRR